MQISLGQMDVKLARPDENLATVREMTAEAARRGSDLVVFPELWSSGYDLRHTDKYATAVDEGLFATVAGLARDYEIAICGSCLADLGQGAVGNTAVYFDQGGINRGVYSKIHLFGMMDEDKYLTAGQERAMVDGSWGPMGLAICYDLRFPELFRAYALGGAQAVILPSEWPQPRLAHWRLLLRARAVENQMFMIACNRVGRTGKTEFFGHSTIVDPMGEIVVEAGDQEQLVTAEIDLKKVETTRRWMPIFADRRPESYK